jgi:hypothetical protein
MLDTARNYFPVDVIKRQLDAMSWVKVDCKVLTSYHQMLITVTTAKCLPLAHRRQSKFPSCRPRLRDNFIQRSILI